MRRVAVTAAGLVMAVTSLSPTKAGANMIVPTVGVTFRLQVSGHTAPGSTFWVAYGPLNGQFGLVRLQPRGAGLFAASRSLPATGRTTFAYLVGHGTVRTRAGLAPGDPVVTIRSIGPVTASAFSARSLQRYAAVG